MQRRPSAPAASPRSPVILVDGANVYGSRPDGWWRNRPQAARRLAAELDQLCRMTGLACTLVLDPMPRNGKSPASTSHVTVVTAPRRGRDAADDAIVARVAALPDPTRAFVYTSDRRLSARLAALGARTAGAGVLLSRIDLVCRSGAG
ncbi:MAG: NYN domain-containing protein [Rhodospirillales bacterium]|nr:NYN domain-containing protein [Rhodospirillales bacterium]